MSGKLQPLISANRVFVGKVDRRWQGYDISPCVTLNGAPLVDKGSSNFGDFFLTNRLPCKIVNT